MSKLSDSMKEMLLEKERKIYQIDKVARKVLKESLKKHMAAIINNQFSNGQDSYAYLEIINSINKLEKILKTPDLDDEVKRVGDDMIKNWRSLFTDEEHDDVKPNHRKSS